jgi:polysaccharide deacetylase family protein (PEP-CTERM system associated)
VIGKKVVHFRAPSFSITRSNPWAIQRLSQAGLQFDSSVVPIRHDRYGIPGTPTSAYRISNGEFELHEFPVSVLPMGPFNIPCGGGGYFRIFPWWFNRWAYRRLESQGKTIHFYIHPWEIDPEQPRVRVTSGLTRFRHYRGLGQTRDRLEKLLSSFSFGATDYPAPGSALVHL